MDPLAIAGMVLLGILLLLLARGLWILYMSSEARIEEKKAEVKAREGRNPKDAQTYHQEIESKALRYVKQIPILGRAFWFFN